jgi:dienelactone hydrolase
MSLRSLLPSVVSLALALGIGTAEAGPTLSPAVRPPATQQPRARGYVGVKLTTTTEGGPVVIAAVFPKSPAEKAGLAEDDVLRAIGEVEVKDVATALRELGALRPGDTVVLRIEHGGQAQRVQVQAAERPADFDAKAAPTAGGFDPILQVRDQDYATARKQFHTVLTRHGPSPQTEPPATPPAGVDVVEFPSGDLHLKAWLARPKDGAQKPAVLFLHGGFAFGYPEDWDASRPFREAGWVVMTPMLRGENGQAGSFSFLYDEVDDVLAAASWLRSQTFVDGQRLFVAGPSAGGTLALLASMASDQFRAAAAFSGPTDQAVLCSHAKQASRDIPFDISDVNELAMRSPLAYARSFKCPARLYVGKAEPEFQPMTRATAEAAKAAGKDVTATIVEGDHSSSVPPGVKLALAFFQGLIR